MSPNDKRTPLGPELEAPPLSNTHSVGSSLTQVQVNEKSATASEALAYPNGHGESALPEDKIEESLENLEDDWENDPDNARNWTSKQKWTAVCIVSAYTFLPPLASSMMAPGIPDIALKYHFTDPTVAALTLSIFLLSFAIGPLALAPLSEMYGRTWVLHISNVFTLGFSLGCAFAPTTGALIGFRFLSGLSGSAPIAIGAGSVGDVFAAKDRASAMALYSLGPLVGPVVGPIAGGFIAQTIGIKWVFIVIAISCAVTGMISIPLLRETYAPVIRMRKAAKNPDPEKAKAHPHLLQEHGSKLHVLWVNLSRPIMILSRSFICFILSLYMAFMYGTNYLMFATFAGNVLAVCALASVYLSAFITAFFKKTYGFNAGIGGLAYLGLGIGFITATIFGAKFADQVYKYLGDKNGGVSTPEMRIPALFFGSLFVPVGLFWYGWSAQAGIHWIMPIIGTGIFGFGMMTTFLPIQLYLVDSFVYAASATSAAALFRSLLGFAFPLFGQQMFDTLGLGGGNSLLAGLAIVLGIPFPIWIYYKGAELRAANPLTRDSTLVKPVKKAP